MRGRSNNGDGYLANSRVPFPGRCRGSLPHTPRFQPARSAEDGAAAALRHAAGPSSRSPVPAQTCTQHHLWPTHNSIHCGPQSCSDHPLPMAGTPQDPSLFPDTFCQTNCNRNTQKTSLFFRQKLVINTAEDLRRVCEVHSKLVHRWHVCLE